MTVAHENPSSRVNLACKALMRYVRTHGLQPNDRLPSQQELRSQLQFSNDTLTNAMKRLVASGMFVRRPGAGTLVADTSPAAIRRLWTVALAIHPAPAMLRMPFAAQLAQSLQSRVLGAGYELRQFGMREEMPQLPKLNDFEGLSDAITHHRADAIVTLPWFDEDEWTRLAEAGLGMCHVGPWEAAPCGVIIDQKAAVAWAVRRLAADGCRRLATVSQNAPRPGFERYWIGFQEGMAHVSADVVACEPITVDVSGGHGGQCAAEHLLALPPAERPDGLIVVDDQLAMGLTATLMHSDYRPAIAMQSNRQAGLSMSLPVFRFEVDIEALADEAAELIFQRLYDPCAPAEVRWHQPVPLDGPADIHPVRSAESNAPAAV